MEDGIDGYCSSCAKDEMECSCDTKALQDEVKHWEGQWEHASNELIEACKRANTAEKEAEALTQRLAEVEKELNGLLMEVAQKFPHESRYETAKRYIRERESRIANAASPALSNSEGKPKCPKHETGGGPCYCDKQGGSDDHK